MTFRTAAVRKAIRVLAIVGIVAASAFVGSTSTRRSHRSTSRIAPTRRRASPEPTLTPPPVEGEPTPQPEPPRNRRRRRRTACRPKASGSGERGRSSSPSTRTAATSTRCRSRSCRRRRTSRRANEGKPLTTWAGADSTPFTFDWVSNEATPYNGIYKLVVVAHARPRTLQSRAQRDRRTRGPARRQRAEARRTAEGPRDDARQRHARVAARSRAGRHGVHDLPRDDGEHERPSGVRRLQAGRHHGGPGVPRQHRPARRALVRRARHATQRRHAGRRDQLAGQSRCRVPLEVASPTR